MSDTTPEAKTSTDDSTDAELTAADHADAAIRDLTVGARIDAGAAYAEIGTDDDAETLVEVTRHHGRTVESRERYAWGEVSLRAATRDGAAETSIVLEESDAAAVRELADALDTLAEHLESEP